MVEKCKSMIGPRKMYIILGGPFEASLRNLTAKSTFFTKSMVAVWASNALDYTVGLREEPNPKRQEGNGSCTSNPLNATKEVEKWNRMQKGK